MSKMKVIGLIGLGLFMTACQATVQTPDIEVEGPSGTKVIIEGSQDKENEQSSGEHNPSEGKFCPPGQAKKNKC